MAIEEGIELGRQLERLDSRLTEAESKLWDAGAFDALRGEFLTLGQRFERLESMAHNHPPEPEPEPEPTPEPEPEPDDDGTHVETPPTRTHFLHRRPGGGRD